MKLRDKVALVTGAGSGIGRAAALLFAREGGRVAVVDLREDAAKDTAEAIERAGGQALALRADVSRGADNESAVAATVARWGRLDVFYANAGVPQAPTPIEDVDEATFDRIMAVNVRGVFLGAKHAAPRDEAAARRRHPGDRLDVRHPAAAGRADPTRPRRAPSSSLTKSLALELAPFGVRAVAIAPVATETPMLPRFSGKEQVDEDLLRKYLPTIPLGRLNTPEDVARTALFLASDDAAMITGACVEVDGGRCI